MRKKTHEGLPEGQDTILSQIQQASSRSLSLYTCNHRDWGLGSGKEGRRRKQRETERERERELRESQGECPSRESGSLPRSPHLGSHTLLLPGALPVLAIISKLWREEFLCATQHLNASQFPHSMNPQEKQESALTVEDRLLLDNWRDAHSSALTTWGFSLHSHCGVKGNTSPLDEARPLERGEPGVKCIPTEPPHGSAPSHWDTRSGSFRTI